MSLVKVLFARSYARVLNAQLLNFRFSDVSDVCVVGYNRVPWDTLGQQNTRVHVSWETLVDVPIAVTAASFLNIFRRRRSEREKIVKRATYSAGELLKRLRWNVCAKQRDRRFSSLKTACCLVYVLITKKKRKKVSV